MSCLIKFSNVSLLIRVVYIFSSLLELAPGSRDLSHSEKRISVLKIVLDNQNCHFEWK